jgi:hypothetical protein
MAEFLATQLNLPMELIRFLDTAVSILMFILIVRLLGEIAKDNKEMRE